LATWNSELLRVQEELKSYGIEVRKGYLKTGVINVLKGVKPGPVMALRADMDALPIEEKNWTPLCQQSHISGCRNARHVWL